MNESHGLLGLEKDMANKNKLDDFHMDDLSFDSIDQGNDRKKGGKDKKAIQRMATSFAGGAAAAFVQPSTIRKLATNALPTGYGLALNNANTMYKGAASLYNVAANELRPALPVIRRATARMMPKVRSHLPKKFQVRLDEFIKGPGAINRGPTQEQMDDGLMASDMAAIFRTQMEAQAESHATDTAERRLREEIDDRRERTTAQRMLSIRNNMERLVSYQDQVTARYQQKSLELNYRQYFATRDILRLQVANSQRDTEFMRSMLQVGVMSEQEKLSLKQRASSNFKERLLSAGQSKASAYVSSFGGKLMKNLQSSVRGAASGLTGGLMGAEQMSDMARDAKDFDPTGQMAAHEGGKAFASMFLEFFGPALLGNVKKGWNPKGKLAQGGGKLEYFFNSLQERANKFAKTDDGDDSFMASVKRAFKELLPRMTVDGSISSSPIHSLDAEAKFDSYTRRSITEVIPGYLSRIHQEVASIRTGMNLKQVERTTYNVDQGKFTSFKEAARNAQMRIMPSGDVQRGRDELSELIDQIDQNKTLSPETRKAFMRQLMTDSMSGQGFDPARYYSADADTSEINGSQRAELEKFLKKRFNTMPGGEMDYVELQGSARKFKSLNNTFGNPKEAMSVYMDAGQRELLEYLKLVTGGESTRMNYKQYQDDYLNSDLGGAKATEQPKATTTLAQKAAEAVANKVQGAGSKVKEAIDVYIKNTGVPILQKARMIKGEYRDQLTGKPIFCLDDIKGTVVDQYNNVVLKAEDVATGLIDSGGRALTSVMDQIRRGLKSHPLGNFVGGVSATWNSVQGGAASAFGNLKAQVISTGSQAARTVSRLFDVYIDDSLLPVLTSARLRAGEYRDMVTNETLTSFDDIAGPVIDQAGLVVLSAEQFLQNIHDGQGKSLSAIAERAKERIKTMHEAHQRKTAAAQGAAPGSSTAAPAAAPGMASDELISLNSQQVQLLTMIHEVLTTRNFGAGDGATIAQGGWFKRTAGRLGKMGGRVYGAAKSVGGRAFGLLTGGLGGVKNLLMGTGSRVLVGAKGMWNKHHNAQDVYVTGVKEPVLKASRMRNRCYLDTTTKKIVNSIKDIHGPVFDVEKGEEVLSKEQFDQGIYVIGKTGFVRVVLKGLGSLASAMVGGYLNVLKVPFTIMSWAAKGALSGLKKAFSDQVDVYVPSNLKVPRLRATLMREDMYYSAANGHLIRGFKNIDGPVKRKASTRADAAATDPEVLSQEEFNAGLVDARGRPLKTLASRLGGGLHSFASGVKDRVKGFVKGVGSLIGGAFGLVGRGLRGIGRMFSNKFGSSDTPATERSFNVLVAIHDMLDSRLPGGEMRKGSWAEQMKNKSSKLADKAEAAAKAGGGAMGKLFGWMKDKLMGGGDDEEEGEEEDDDDGDTTIINNNSGGNDGNRRDGRGRKRGGFRRNMSARWKKGKRSMGRSKTGRMFGRMTKGVSKYGGKFASKLGRFKPRGLGVGGIAAGLLAGAGGDWLVNKLGRKSTAGRALDTGMTVAGNVSTAASVASMVGVGGGGAAATGAAAAGGTAAAGGGILAGIGGGLSAAGAGILAAVGAPVLIGAAALALIGTAAYMGYKYYQSHKSAPLRKLRMAQYGVDVTNTDRMVKVGKLEDELLKSVSYGKDGAKLDTEKVDIEALHKAMGNDGGWFGTNDDEKERQTSFIVWFRNRFKPVFITHLTALHAIDPKAALDDVDDDLSPANKMKYMNAVRDTAANYNSTVSPFADGPLVAGTQAIDAAFAEVKAAIEKELSKDKKQGAAAGAVAAAAGTAAVVKSGAAQAGAQPTTIGKKPGSLALPATATAAGVVTLAGSVTSVRGAAGPRGVNLSNGITALQAIRYRTYGLTDLAPDRVQTLAMLEAAVFENLSFGAGGAASFDGDAKQLYIDFASRFGEARANAFGWYYWRGWFQGRFLPAVLAYASSVRGLNNGAPLDRPEQALKPEQLVEVGAATIAAKRSLLGMGLSVWSYLTSPWKDYELNADSKSTYVSMLSLKGAVKKQVVTEPTVSGKKAAVEKSKAEMDALVTPGGGSFAQKLGGWIGGAAAGIRDFGKGTYDAAASAVSVVGQGASDMWSGVKSGLGMDGGPVGSPVTHPGNGTGGSINDIAQPTGSKGWSGVKDVILGAAKMVGVSPQLMATIASIESGFRPNVGAGTSSATGLYQFIKETWDGMLRKYGAKYGIAPGTPPTDARANALMGAEFLKENTAILKKHLGRAPTDTELYAAHFMGPDTAGQILASDPGTNAASTYPKQARANHSIFYNKNGSPRSIGQVIAELDRRVQGHRIDINSGAKSPNNVAGSVPTTGAGGLTTTTTANGAQGGLGPKMAGVMSAPAPFMQPTGSTGAANDGSFLKLPNYTSTPVPQLDRSSGLQLATTNGTEAGDLLMEQERKASAATAMAAQVRGRDSNAQSAQQTATVVNLLSKSLQVQMSMESKLGAILSAVQGVGGKVTNPSPGGVTVAAGGESNQIVRGARPLEAATQSAPINVKRSA